MLTITSDQTHLFYSGKRLRDVAGYADNVLGLVKVKETSLMIQTMLLVW